MKYLPLFADLRGKPCLVVGGGEIAARKISLLCRAEVDVRIVARELAETTRELVARHGLSVAEREYETGDIEGMSLVVSATDNQAVNEAVFRDCEAAGLLVNSVDKPSLSNVIFPALIDRSPVLIAVSTGGGAPTLARVVRGWIEARLPARLGALAEFVRARRNTVKDHFSSISARQRLWERVLGGATAEHVYTGDDAAAEAAFVQELDGTDSGFVALVGAGPGDPELLTLKALRLLQSADVVMYDNLVNRQVLDYVRRDAELLYVGKKWQAPSTRQESIHAVMLDHARAGRNVVRLKGGDPFIFGRGGEELEALSTAGVSCVAVPGITAATGAASYAGIPLTHRDVSQSVRFVTGHRSSNRTNLDWPELAKPGQTVIVYMGLPGLEEILGNLVKHGAPASTPAALIEKATLPEQRLIIGTLDDLAGKVRTANIRGPTTIIIGQVINHRTEAGAGAGAIKDS